MDIRTARIKYYYLSEEYEGITTDQWREIADQMPDDARILRWGHDYGRCKYYLIVSSDSFPEQKPGMKMPTVDIVFESSTKRKPTL